MQNVVTGAPRETKGDGLATALGETGGDGLAGAFGNVLGTYLVDLHKSVQASGGVFGDLHNIFVNPKP